MRPIGLGLAVLTLSALAGLGIARPAHEPSQSQAYAVRLDIRCAANGSVTATVNPWRAELAEGQEIEWILQGQAASDSFAIQPKRSGAQNWPYQDSGRRKGTKADRAGYGNMKAGQVGRRFQYGITMWCDRRETVDTVVIDPDIVIRGR